LRIEVQVWIYLNDIINQTEVMSTNSNKETFRFFSRGSGIAAGKRRKSNDKFRLSSGKKTKKEKEGEAMDLDDAIDKNGNGEEDQDRANEDRNGFDDGDDQEDLDDIIVSEIVISNFYCGHGITLVAAICTKTETSTRLPKPIFAI
jgi:hypothetical protein